jgi:hypothetical protein
MNWVWLVDADRDAPGMFLEPYKSGPIVDDSIPSVLSRGPWVHEEAPTELGDREQRVTCVADAVDFFRRHGGTVSPATAESLAEMTRWVMEMAQDRLPTLWSLTWGMEAVLDTLG